MIRDDIINLIGKTPIIKLKKISSLLNIELYSKLEMYNPGGSVKDRAAYFMLKKAFDEGIIKEGFKIIEPTSGNTGISLALLGKVMNLKVTIVMPQNMSIERQKLIKHFGAEIILTPKEQGMKGAIERAKQILSQNKDIFMPMQFENPANVFAHYTTTAPEIWEELGGDIDVFICGVGTGGSITGIGRFLKEKNSKIKIIAVEPENSAVLSGKNAGIHSIQGIGAGFVPKILDRSVIDEIIIVSDEDAFEFTKKIAQYEGISAGLSSGAVLAAIFKISDRFKNSKILTLFPDNFEKYLSIF